jgi:hypothetical protein
MKNLSIIKPNKLLNLLFLIIFLVFPHVTNALPLTACPSGGNCPEQILYYCGGEGFSAQTTEYKTCLQEQEKQKQEDELERIKQEELKKIEDEKRLEQKMQEMIEIELERERDKIKTELEEKIKKGGNEELEKIKSIQGSIDTKTSIIIQQKSVVPTIQKKEILNKLEQDVKEEKDEESVAEKNITIIDDVPVEQNNELKKKQSFPVKIFNNFKFFLSKLFKF